MKTIRINTPDVQPFETEHIAAVRALSPECMVLLKNDGTLPIAKGGKLALYGSGARRTIKGGTGSGDVNSRKYITVEEGMENAGFEITTKAWLDAYDTAVTAAKKAFYGEIRKQADAVGMNPIWEKFVRNQRTISHWMAKAIPQFMYLPEFPVRVLTVLRLQVILT